MGRKARSTAVLIVLVVAAGMPLFGQSTLVSAYRSGKIVLEPDPGFGRDIDWASVVLNFANDMTVAPDGSVFVANNREHVILKFDPDGRLIKTFGRKGQGPGDFEFPANLDVLDIRTLVVGEYPGNRRISLFDFEGRLARLLRTNAAAFDIAALRGNAIAYTSWTFGRGDRKETGGTDHHQVFIKDALDGREVLVADVSIPYRGFSGGLRSDGSVCGAVVIAGTSGGDLLVGDTRKAAVEIFGPAAKKLRTIALRLEPFPLTSAHLRRYKALMIRDLKNGPAASMPGFDAMIRDIEAATWDDIVDGHLPLFKDLLVDDEGNLLVIKNTDCVRDCPILIQAYSPEGAFLAEFELDPGPFKVEIDYRFRNLCFTDRGIFGMFPRKDDPDEIIVLMKSALDQRAKRSSSSSVRRTAAMYGCSPSVQCP